jgi:hypothetical protein
VVGRYDRAEHVIRRWQGWTLDVECSRLHVGGLKTLTTMI